MKIDRAKIEMQMADKEITQAELAKSIGVCPQAISALLKKESCIPQTAGKLAHALNVPIASII